MMLNHTSKYICPEYEQLKTDMMQGWKTWNVNSVFSFVHMPDGLSVNLSMKEYRNGYSQGKLGIQKYHHPRKQSKAPAKFNFHSHNHK